jgi:hypothetical protein
VGGSVVGALHVESGVGCDDAHGWRVCGDVAVLVIADGAGSRPGTSAIGAHVAVAAALDHLEARPDAAIADVFAASRAALEDEALVLDLAVDRLATTLAVAVLAPDRTVVGQIGDGVAVVEHDDGTIEAVAIADRFEYANQVVFLTADAALDHLKVFTTDAPARGVALSTDGLRYKILDDLHSGRPFAPFFEESWGFARGAAATSEAIVRFIDGVEDQTGDDKTLVLAVRDAEGEAGDARALSDRPALPPEPAPEVEVEPAPEAEAEAEPEPVAADPDPEAAAS